MKIKPLQAAIIVVGTVVFFLGDANQELVTVGLDPNVIELGTKVGVALLTLLGAFANGKMPTRP